MNALVIAQKTQQGALSTGRALPAISTTIFVALVLTALLPLN